MLAPVVTLENVTEDHWQDVLDVCAMMREPDFTELYACMYGEDPHELADRMLTVPGFSWLAYYGDRPAAIFGAQPMWPGVWQAFAFGTEDYPKVIRTLTRHCRQFCIPALRSFGVHLVQCWVLSDYPQARKWVLKTFPGAREECTVPGFGKGREAFTLITWRPGG